MTNRRTIAGQIMALIFGLCVFLAAGPVQADPDRFKWPVPHDPERYGRTWQEFQHLGLDLGAKTGDRVLPIGPVYKLWKSSHNGYRIFADRKSDKGLQEKGWVVFALHRKADGSYFWACYGHVTPHARITATHDDGQRPEEPLSWNEDEEIATIADYWRIDSKGERRHEPHLHLAIWDSDSTPSPLGYGTAQANPTFRDPEDFIRSERPYPANRPFVRLLEFPVHHLGDNNFNTPVNVGFQERSEGLQWVLPFALEPSLCRRQDGWVVLNLRGAEGSSLYLNEVHLGQLHNTLEDNGKSQAFPIPPGTLRPERNLLRLISNLTSGTDNDDFEFDDVNLLFGDPQQVEPGN